VADPGRARALKPQIFLIAILAMEKKPLQTGAELDAK
jgi:hypothetical protein